MGGTSRLGWELALFCFGVKKRTKRTLGETQGDIPSQHVFSELDLLRVLLKLGCILDDGVFGRKALVTLGHGVPGNIEAMELGVDGINDGRNHGEDKRAGLLDDIDILISKVHELGDVLEAVDGVGIELRSFNVFHGEGEWVSVGERFG